MTFVYSIARRIMSFLFMLSCKRLYNVAAMHQSDAEGYEKKSRLPEVIALANHERQINTLARDIVDQLDSSK